MIEARIRKFLSTRAEPRHLETEEIREDVIGQIVALVERSAPEHDRESWLGQVIEKAMIKQKGNAWPSLDVWAIALGGVKYTPAEAPATIDRNSQTFGDIIFATRIQQRLPVGEYELWSARVDRCLAEGRISLHDVRAYRTAAFKAKRKVYGDSAIKWLAEKDPAMFAKLFPKLADGSASVRPQHAADQEGF
jgi:hypothetical protein